MNAVLGRQGQRSEAPAGKYEQSKPPLVRCANPGFEMFLTAWLRKKGAAVVLVRSEESADLLDYHSKRTKSDRRNSRVLATLPLLHPEGTVL
jgi:hypothetical protein